MGDAVTKHRRATVWLLPVLLAAGVASLAVAVFLPPPGSRTWTHGPGETGPVAFDLPDFTLTERSGKPVSKADLQGKVWVASFVFTRCTGPCPSVTGTIARLQADLDLANRPDLRLVTFTVDPDRDTPDELKKYATHFHAHPDRWLFLTGPEADVHKLAKDGFKIAAARSASPTPPEGQEFDHSTKIAVVDKKGRVRGYFDGYRGPNDDGGAKYAESYEHLKQAVTALLSE
jgi:cytochrome oxidase Cu insertion factor (SCO1/SenC/PrrC family)